MPWPLRITGTGMFAHVEPAGPTRGGARIRRLNTVLERRLLVEGGDKVEEMAGVRGRSSAAPDDTAGTG